ncbi:MAG: SDR family oxidoreductase [Cellulomonadaceae bacterium]|jgi:3-oxoacyl-[acyl-carrier protein] reductase|nr:SDR family oxidoreductase [Cellulomonadaceae bacterium]
MKYALVTGGASGIGRAIAEKLLGNGYHVLAGCLPGEDTSAVDAEWSAAFPEQFGFVPANLGTMSGLDECVAQVTAVTDKLDVLVINAGMTSRGSLEDLTFEQWNLVMNVNVTIPVFLVQKLGLTMNEPGRIIFMGSLMGIQPHSMSLAYGVTKSAVLALARNLPKFFDGKDITINAIAPGFVETPWQLEKPQEIRDNINNKVALHRFAKPQEIADLAYHLVENGFINGTVVTIDGAYSYK